MIPPHPLLFFLPSLNASWFLLTWSESIPSTLWSLAYGTGLRCHLLSPGHLWYVLCLFAPVYLMEDVLVAGLVCSSSVASNFVPKQRLLKGSSDSSVLRLVDGQTVPLTTGFLVCVSLVLLFCPHVRQGGRPKSSVSVLSDVFFITRRLGSNYHCCLSPEESCVCEGVCELSSLISSEEKKAALNPCWCSVSLLGVWCYYCSSRLEWSLWHLLCSACAGGKAEGQSVMNCSDNVK